MRSYLQLLFLVVPVLSAVINQAYLGCDTDDFHPAWEIENRLTIVPLNKTARTGVLPEAVEEGLIAAAGPRFANQIYANISQDGKLGCGLGCIRTIIKESPCVYNAIRDKNLEDLFKCGLNKSDICKCVDCFPGPLGAYLKEVLCDSKLDSKVTDTISYADFSYVGESDLFIQGYRGDLKKYSVEQVKRSGLSLGCSSCGSCGCCIGVCIPVVNICVGGCG